MTRKRYRLLLAFLVSGCAACASAPVRYFTLTPGGATPPTPIPGAGITINVRTTVPVPLNHGNLMVRTGEAEMTLLENARWVSPVSDELSNAVRLQLQRRWAQSMEPDRPHVFTQISVNIDVARLESELGRYTLLEVSWSAKLSGMTSAPSDITVSHCVFRAREAIHRGFAEMVEGYQRDARALGDAIFVTLTRAGDIDEVACGTWSRISQ